VGSCKFEAIYNDVEREERFQRWTCDEKVHNSRGFCVFHDKTKSEWDDNTFSRFRARIQEAIGKGTTLYCIGYHFPTNISFKLLLPLDRDEPRRQRHLYSKIALHQRQRYPYSEIALDHDARGRISNIPIYLCDADFGGQVEFSHCTFKCPLSLSGGIFRREVLFRKTKLKGKFYPRSTTFYGKVDFRKTEFVKADFHDTVFKNKANFRFSTISNNTRFLDAKFQDRANFVGATFSGETQFIGVSFNKAFFSPEVDFQDKTAFKYVVFENGEKIHFVTKNLSKVSFMNTDITRVRFSDNATWGEGANNKFKVIDERELENFFEKSINWFSWNDVPGIDKAKFISHLNRLLALKLKDDCDVEKSLDGTEISVSSVLLKLNKALKKVTLSYRNQALEFSIKECNNLLYVSSFESTSLDSIKAIYRNLRENYEYRLRYDEAGEFFIREMELKRNYHQDSHKRILKKTDRFRRNISLTGFYRLASYGEKVRMPFLLMGITIFISLITSLYYFHPTYYPSFDYDGLAPLGNATERSFTIFLQLRNENFIWLDYIYKVMGILSLGLLAIPLRRKFERKFRH
jgi:uncharacterized protein YjbI with pentapeptide repeats